MTNTIRIATSLFAAIALAGCGDKTQTFGACQFKAQSVFAHTSDRDEAASQIGDMTESCMLSRGYEIAISELKGIDHANCESFLKMAVNTHPASMSIVQGVPYCYSRFPDHWWLAK